MQIFDYKEEVRELIETIYTPASATDKEYISKSLDDLYLEVCDVIPESNFKMYDLYEVLKELGFFKYASKETGFEYRLLQR